MPGSDDLVARLRKAAAYISGEPEWKIRSDCRDAADEIERLKADVQKERDLHHTMMQSAMEQSALAATATRERDEARAEVELLMRVFRAPGCALFLDGRNEHGSHVIMSYPTNMPENVEDDISESAEEVLSAAEALGFVVGEDHVWTEWRWIEPQIGDEGRVELRGYWEFVRIDQGLSRAALTAKGGENGEG